MPAPRWPQVLGTSERNPKTGTWTVALVTTTKYGVEVAEIGTGGREQDAKTSARARLKKAVTASEVKSKATADAVNRKTAENRRRHRKKDTR